jgi:hypothetical protein
MGALRVEIGMKDPGSKGAKQLALVLCVKALLELGGAEKTTGRRCPPWTRSRQPAADLAWRDWRDW